MLVGRNLTGIKLQAICSKALGTGSPWMVGHSWRIGFKTNMRVDVLESHRRPIGHVLGSDESGRGHDTDREMVVAALQWEVGQRNPRGDSQRSEFPPLLERDRRRQQAVLNALIVRVAAGDLTTGKTASRQLRCNQLFPVLTLQKIFQIISRKCV